MKILVTGGAGFIGSHVASFYAEAGHEVTVFDNLSRAKLLFKEDRNARYNWDFLSRNRNIKMVLGDVRDAAAVAPYCRDAEVIFHTAGQTAVTTSVTDPRPDFETNVMGTFNVLDAVQKADSRKTVIYCSTNKVYGDNVNEMGLKETAKRYTLSGNFDQGIPESCSIDHCKHTPYGCSKLTADLYMQDWARLYGHRVGVFRMSCIYGTRQFGFEDQGWVAWFTIAAMKKLPVTIFGDGKQVRDVLYVSDLVNLYDKFVQSDLPYGVFNTGGGVKYTMSLLELVDMLATRLGSRLALKFEDWRPSDQKAYISDIRLAREKLGWTPRVSPEEGLDHLLHWVRENAQLW